MRKSKASGSHQTAGLRDAVEVTYDIARASHRWSSGIPSVWHLGEHRLVVEKSAFPGLPGNGIDRIVPASFPTAPVHLGSAKEACCEAMRICEISRGWDRKLRWRQACHSLEGIHPLHVHQLEDCCWVFVAQLT